MDTKGQLLKTGHMETINASDFQARCLEILDRVPATGERVVILKRGRPVAELQSSFAGNKPDSRIRIVSPNESS